MELGILNADFKELAYHCIEVKYTSFEIHQRFIGLS